MRKNIWPLREVVRALDKAESSLIQRSLSPYLRDVYEHTIQVIDNVESLREVLPGSTGRWPPVLQHSLIGRRTDT